MSTFRDALLARYHEGYTEGYTEGLHDMAEAVVGYLNSQPSVEGALGDDPELTREAGTDRTLLQPRNCDPRFCGLSLCSPSRAFGILLTIPRCRAVQGTDDLHTRTAA